MRPNNSFKPSPLRGLGAGSYDSAIAVAATLPGLTQALAAMKQTIALLLLLLSSQASYAKCAGDFYTFTGTVVDASGKPLPGAAVGISWNEYEGITGPAIAITDADGRYRIPIGFSKYSGNGAAYEDECNQTLRWISVTAYKGTLRSPFLRQKVVGKETVRLPDIKVWVEAEKERPTVQSPQPRG